MKRWPERLLKTHQCRVQLGTKRVCLLVQTYSVGPSRIGIHQNPNVALAAAESLCLLSAQHERELTITAAFYPSAGRLQFLRSPVTTNPQLTNALNKIIQVLPKPPDCIFDGPDKEVPFARRGHKFALELR